MDGDPSACRSDPSKPGQYVDECTSGPDHGHATLSPLRAPCSRPVQDCSFGSEGQVKIPLEDIPLDVLYEILGRVTPRDLLTISCLSKPLRNVLISKDSSSAWRASLKIVDAPECPKFMSLPEWAIILFGDYDCYSCGSWDSVFPPDINWTFYKRLCPRCAAIDSVKNGIRGVEVLQEQYPENAAIIKTLITTTKMSRLRGNPEDTTVCLASDAAYVDSILRQYQQNIASGKTESEHHMQTFIARRRDKVVKMHDRAETLKVVVSEYQKRIKEERNQEIESRLVLRGWNDWLVRVDRYKHRIRYKHSPTILTENEWERILPTIEEGIREKDRYYKAMQHDERVRQRMRNAYQVYEKYLDTIRPIRRLSLPQWGILLIEEPLNSLLHSPRTDMLKREEFEARPDIFLDALAAWRTRTSDDLMLLLPDWFRARYQAPVTSTSNGCFGLAIAVFQRDRATDLDQFDDTSSFEDSCQCCDWDAPVPLIGWENVMFHDCQYKFDNSFTLILNPDAEDTLLKFSERGYAAAASLVRLLGLDDRVVTSSELDKRNRKFFCNNCPAKYVDGTWSKSSLTWRDCVAHYIEPSVTETHQKPSWIALNSTQARKANTLDMWPLENEDIWDCNLCPTTFMTSSKDELFDHLKIAHSKSRPIMTRDYFLNPFRFTHYDTCLFGPGPWVPIASSKTRRGEEPLYDCTHCRTRTGRLQSIDGIISHLMSRHSISTPGMPIDCVEHAVA